MKQSGLISPFVYRTPSGCVTPILYPEAGSQRGCREERHLTKRYTSIGNDRGLSSRIVSTTCSQHCQTSNAASTRPEADSLSLALQPFGKPALFSAILLHILAVRPVHEYNISMGGDTPQVTVLSKVAIPDQRHDGITSWHSSQVEGLVALTSSAGSSPVSGIQAGQGVTANPDLLPCCAEKKSSAILLHPLEWRCTGIASGDADGFPPEKRRFVLLSVLLPRQAAHVHRRRRRRV